MRWGYKTIHFELKKDGLLGGTFLDESEMEEILNDYGSSGWELISMLETRDGAIAVFKQPLDGSSSPLNVEVEETAEQKTAGAGKTAAVSVVRDTVEEGSEAAAFEDDEIYGYEDSVDEELPGEPVPVDEKDEEEEPGIGSIRIE